jgi:predicted flap endonuclease-1-like 5' DNA nuclease
MGTEEKVLASAGDERDDLQVIRGIDPKLADALSQIGGLRFEDLAQYTPQSARAGAPRAD